MNSITNSEVPASEKDTNFADTDDATQNIVNEPELSSSTNSIKTLEESNTFPTIGDADIEINIHPKHSELVEIDESVHVERVDAQESSSLLAAKTWDELNLNNLIGQAQNGSGKTATFALAMLSKVDRAEKQPQAICLCPTRELARQNMAVIEELGVFTHISTFLSVPQCKIYDSQRGAQIIVGTPGKVMELLKKRVLPTAAMKLFVLDEADEMIDHRNNMAPQVQQIRRFFKQKLQVLLFSATYPDDVRAFAEHIVPYANKIKVKKEELTLSCIKQTYIVCSENDIEKFKILSNLYGCMTIGQSIIFVNSRKSAFELALRMQEEGHSISLICGTQSSGPEKMEHEMRDRIMSEFRNGETKVLICTDVLSRGIDVPQVTLVINYDIPRIFHGHLGSASEPAVNMETYIHRIGRTGRFGLKGIAINLVSPNEVKLLKQIENYYNCEILPMASDPEDIEDMIKRLRL